MRVYCAGKRFKMTTNAEIDLRRNESVARALAYSSTFVADRAIGAEVWDV